MVDQPSSHQLPVDNAKVSPGRNFRFISRGKYWTQDLDNNDFLRMFRRHGIGNKIIMKKNSDIFKNGYELNDDHANTILHEYNVDSIVSFAHLNAEISGFSLIYIAYPDVQKIADYANPAPSNTIPVFFYVIPKAWIQEDIKKKGQNDDSDFYRIYQESGSGFNIHKSRIIRVKNNDMEMSTFEPAFDALNVAENILWGAGQTIWRSAQGFPVITVDDPKMITDADGNTKSEIDILTAEGVLKDINSETGFIGDSRYNFDFKGAEGKAIKPGEYWNINLDIIGASVNIPKDILVGVSAGAVTGSEVNLREYYSEIASIQVNKIEPVFKELLKLFNIIVDDLEFIWNPVFEQTQQEQATTLKTDAEALNIALSGSIIDKNEYRDTLRSRHEWIKINDGPAPDNPTSQTIIGPNPLFQSNNSITSVRKQYDVSDNDIVDSLKQSINEGSALPRSTQKIEKQFIKTVGDQYSQTSNAIKNIFADLNSDNIDEPLRFKNARSKK